MNLQLSPYLVMDGNAQEAIKFYEQALDAKVGFMQTFGESPENPDYPLPAEAKDRVMHAALKIGDFELLFSDTFPGQSVQSGNQVTLCISTDDKEKSRRIFDALSQGGKVDMELQETFFSPAYGSLTDKFGVTFQIYTSSKQ